MEELSADIRVALPHITERRMGLLMKYFEENGVHSKDDMAKVEAVDLVNTLGTADAKKLVAYFNYARGFRPEGFRAEDLEGVKVSYHELQKTLDEEHAKREQVHEQILCDIDKSVLQITEMHDDTIKSVRDTQTQCSQAHEEMLQIMQEEERLRAERRAQRQREFEEEMQRLRERQQSNPARNLLRGIESMVKIWKHARDTTEK